MMESALHDISRIVSKWRKLPTKFERIKLHQTFETESGSFADSGIATAYAVNIIDMPHQCIVPWLEHGSGLVLGIAAKKRNNFLRKRFLYRYAGNIAQSPRPCGESIDQVLQRLLSHFKLWDSRSQLKT
ncbi:hypothetical protein D3C78_1287350 [compost metagenome]